MPYSVNQHSSLSIAFVGWTQNQCCYCITPLEEAVWTTDEIIALLNDKTKYIHD